VLDRLEGRVFVAHNERFDWGHIRRELLAAGTDVPDVERLCTVRLGRFLWPRLRSHGLDSLATHYGIRVHERHRAFGDARATAQLLLRLLKDAEARGITDLASLTERMRRPRRRRA
jgi:DNA polymerase-3 subunit epsilon